MKVFQENINPLLDCSMFFGKAFQKKIPMIESTQTDSSQLLSMSWRQNGRSVKRAKSDLLKNEESGQKRKDGPDGTTAQ